MTHAPLPTPGERWALFLDFDGTLVDLADHPDRVSAAPPVRALLQRLARRLDGALAVVSGRTVAALEVMLGFPGFPLAGVHGLEHRDASGRLHRAVARDDRFRHAQEALEAFVAEHPGTHLEDKGSALALHYRNAPTAAAAAEDALRELLDGLGDAFTLQHGKAVLELKPAGHDKGTVVATLLAAPPFRGRRPVFVGDDVTDEDAFRLVRGHGGHAIRVGDLAQSAATAQLDSVEEVIAWLTEVDRILATSH